MIVHVAGDLLALAGRSQPSLLEEATVSALVVRKRWEKHTSGSHKVLVRFTREH